MSLPLPNLDDRFFPDLFEEGRALIPRYAPEWTDHNASDPGITLIELLAYLTEQELYRLNVVGDPHRRAFLKLAGPLHEPLGPGPATVLLTPDSRPPARTVETVSAGDFFVAWQPPPSLGRTPPRPEAPPSPLLPTVRFRARYRTKLTGIVRAAVQVFDGRKFTDASGLLQRQQPVAAWGDDPVRPDGLTPERQPALYLGLDPTLARRPTAPGTPDGDSAPDLTLWFDVVEPTPESAADIDEGCPASPPPSGVRVAWEWFSPRGWVPLPAGVLDETHAFTRSGRAVLPGAIFQAPANRTVGAVTKSLFYVRCRLAAVLPDAPPQIRGVLCDAVVVEQVEAAQTAAVRRVGPDELLVLSDLKLGGVENDAADWRTELLNRGWKGIGGWGAWPVSYYTLGELRRKAGDPSTGSISDPPPWNYVPLVVLGLGNGMPGQQFELPCVPAAPDDPTPRLVIPKTLRVWTMEPPWAWTPDGQAARWTEIDWKQTGDLISSRRTNPAFLLDADNRLVIFGDGEYGRVPPPGALVAASYHWSAGSAGNVGGGLSWRKADDPTDVTTGRATRFRNAAPAANGRDAEPLASALNRLADVLRAPETLIGLALRLQEPTLDGLPAATIEAVPHPFQATTLADFERLARAAPDTAVQRARAWTEIDPALPGLVVPGTVTVAVVPALPADRPVPTGSLLQRVARYLESRRPIACRVRVTGPEYVDVKVQAVLHVPRGTSSGVGPRAEKTVKDYLHPLRGGPEGSGWPFGRSVHPGEVLKCLQNVEGARFVTGLQLAAGAGPWGEDAIPLGPLALVALTSVLIDVREDA